jgi:hypothetical protein
MDLASCPAPCYPFFTPEWATRRVLEYAVASLDRHTG